ncbi:hypothetical protein A3A49_02360 [Candidatus Curtissbacteria bacterium RIFCSPLOWO2_01_FULL_38_11b]|uniref:Blue (type 1) copper domain-containing protein n=1 Tax=Candidatus Curtissbacteria bacterium RIFCSPLOWO2_01_FULL_38_11b TaxID=1797725 RepID=A0A1F5GZB2_9BACT|nr:MAG: hypothetical protein A3A49_02360 [Candidatus Curtissbacteria bacterium RIFCSPLOWO2_01_FULL_38_11b]
MKKPQILNLLLLIIVVIFISFFIFNNFKKDTSLAPSSFVKTPHFLDSTPMHDEIYVAQPVNITINFDFDLATGSEIFVVDDQGQQAATGDIKIEDSNTALKKDLTGQLSDGKYKVMYKACWPDGSCHDGSFEFSIDSKKISEYLDMRGRGEVTVKMTGLKYEPEKIIISPETKIVWENLEDIGHFVNTETHPEHTYFPSQNSRELKLGDIFETVFEKPGQYNYHCSAHVPEGMLGAIVVAN